MQDRTKHLPASTVTLQIGLALACGGVVLWDTLLQRGVDAGTAVLVLAWVNNVAFVLQIMLLRRAVGGFWNPIVLSSLFLFLFTSGQLVLHSFGVRNEVFDLMAVLSPTTVRTCLRFVLVGYSLYQLGVFAALRRGGPWTRPAEDSTIGYTSSSAVRAAMVLILVGVVPYTLSTLTNLSIVLSSGYRAYYAADAGRLVSGVAAFGYYLLAGLVLLAVGGNKPQKRFAVIALVVIALLRLASGDRGGGFVMLLSAFMLHNNFISARVGSRAFMGVSLGILLVYAVSIIAAVRVAYAPGVDVLTLAVTELERANPMITTLSSLGATLYPLAKVFELVPLYQAHIWGGSYLAAVVLLIPSPIRIGPLGRLSMLVTSPASWLMATLNMSYGPGFTPFAEAFLNFGWAGLLFMFVYGVIITVLVSPTGKRIEMPLAKGLGILAFLLFAMASRSSMNYILAFSFRYLLIPYVLLLLMRNTHGRSDSGDTRGFLQTTSDQTRGDSELLPFTATAARRGSADD